MNIHKLILDSKCNYSTFDECGGSGFYFYYFTSQDFLERDGWKFYLCQHCKGQCHKPFEFEVEIEVPEGYEWYSETSTFAYFRKSFRDLFNYKEVRIPYKVNKVYKSECKWCMGTGAYCLIWDRECIEGLCSRTKDYNTCDMVEQCDECKGKPIITWKCLEIKVENNTFLVKGVEIERRKKDFA